MQESDTYLAIEDQGQEKFARETIIRFGQEQLGPPDETVRGRLANVTDLERLRRMVRRATNPTSWQEILDTPRGRVVNESPGTSLRHESMRLRFASGSAPTP